MSGLYTCSASMILLYASKNFPVICNAPKNSQIKGRSKEKEYRNRVVECFVRACVPLQWCYEGRAALPLAAYKRRSLGRRDGFLGGPTVVNGDLCCTMAVCATCVVSGVGGRHVEAEGWARVKQDKKRK